ncbi:response regulator [Photobacterium sp. WH77]|uniref:response regulator n=1 Tax=unclassified Photobacterium TaxID=2628852 RepID=UPI001EDB21E3|nr:MULTISPECIES: response regulator [unclassified Photobacterium]MCG2839227.1 response regulator [Photobacterium sp. WH77]MCG2846844.1 response regulator [Photobacterium sp. WH80]
MKSILIIEDNKVMAQILAQLLRNSIQPQTLLHASSVSQAEAIFMKSKLLGHTLDCVFLDLNLNHPLDGLSFLGQIKQDHPDLPVIVVTAENEMETVKKVISHKPDGYIVKPLSMQKLNQCLAKISSLQLDIEK